MLKVIGAGFPRTGTTSMKAALEKLGLGPCHHMKEVIQHPEQVDRWRHAVSGDPVNWDWVFEGYQAAVDWPSSYFWRELAAAYPDAKVVLTIRDPHRWYTSMRNTIFHIVSPDADPELSRHMPLAARWPVVDFQWAGTFGEGIPDEEHAVQVFERHIAEVYESLPADRLLVYELGQGWGPLCDFLGVNPPADTPFPHLNDTESMRHTLQQVRSGSLITPFGPAK